MSHIPTTLAYSSNHEWLRADDHGCYVVGITDHAQSLLGDITFVHLPNVDEHVAAGESCAVTESLKAASDVCAPISGNIVAINESLEIAPELVNNDPYGDGWLFIIQTKDEHELNSLLTAEAYQNSLE